MTSPLLRQLAALCEKHPVARKYVFVPSRQVGYNLGSALARAGVPWVNLEFVTPAEHALRAVGPTLLAEGYRPVNEDALMLLVERLIDALLDAGDDHYFADVPRSTGLARAFRGTLQSLRLSGVLPEEVEAGLSSPKGRFIARAYRQYVDALTQLRALDDALVFRRALQLLGGRNGAAASRDVYAILDETPVPGLAGAYVNAVTHGSLLRLGIDGIETSVAPHTAGARFADAPRVATGESERSSFRLLTTVGSESEVQEVLRTILDEGVPFDDVEIAYGGEAPYLARLVDLADRFEIPIAFSAGIPASLTRPGQAVLGFLRWVATGFSADALVDLARGGLLDPILPHEGERALRGYELARQIRLARIAKGRHQYPRQLRRREGASRGRDGRNASLSLQAVEALLELIQADAEASIAQLARSAIAFLERFARVSSDRDKVAIDSLKERLEQIEAADPENRPHPEAPARLLEMLREHKIEASTARQGAVYAVPVHRAGYAGRKHLFVVGLDETTFPGTPIEDPVLLDDERSRLSPALTLKRTGPGEQVWHLHRVLRSGAGRVVLIARRSGIHDAREVYPSAAFQALLESEAPIHQPLVGPAEDALQASESFLGGVVSADLVRALASTYPHLSAGYAARAARESGFTAFRGCLGDEIDESVVPGRTKPTSASKLEGFVACPYRYFLSDVLRVRPPDDPPLDPAHWLTPMEFGSLLHEVCRQFMRTLQERKERADAERHAPLIDEILGRVVAEAEDEMPPHNEAAYRADVGRLRRAARVFLADEARRDVEPVAFEWSFGDEKGPDATGPVVVPLGDGVEIQLRGRIDRVDRVDVGYEIWDYKTGSPSRYDEVDLLGGGRNLQWALYAHAFKQALEARGESAEVKRSGYLFIGDRGHGLRYGDAPPSSGQLGELLQPLLEMAEAGAFLHLQKEDACRFCDYRTVCEGEAESCKDLNKAIKEDPSLLPDDLPFRDALLRWIEVES